MWKKFRSFFSKKPRVIEIRGRGPAEGELDPNSPTWQWIDNWATAELQRLRKLNDNDQDETKTARLRGGIWILERLRKLPDKPEKMEGLMSRDGGLYGED